MKPATFYEYDSQIFISYIFPMHVDVVWNRYIEDYLKAIGRVKW